MYDDLVQLYQKRLKQTSYKNVRPHEFQERYFVLKKILFFQSDSRSKWTPNYEGPCAMILTTMDGGKPARPVNANAVKSTLSKIQKRKAR